ncbi:MAG: aldo/keto reductase [Alphaproteobacteria bacterium]|nr:aldo/keto reductase [Alphaproteobacteria bacterium]
MQPVRLGRSGLLVSPLCLGTMTFGAEADEATSRSIMDLALDRGVFFWDTADMYGTGESERIVGRALRGRRDRIVLATKAFAPMGPGPNDRGLSARHLIAACDASLRRLHADWIDLYYLHLPDDGVPIDETLRALEDLRSAGKIRYTACSNHTAWQTAELVHTARAHGWPPLTAVQPLYNLANRDIEVELLPMAHHHGLGVVTYSPLARGVLTGKYRWGADAPADSRLARANRRFLQAEWREESVALADGVVALAAQRGCTPAQLALRWAMANERVHSVILGARTLDQAREAIAAADLPWDHELEATCDALVPPGCHTGRGFPDSQYPVRGRVLAE